MTDTIDITAPDLERLLALDAADKAKRRKLRACALEREARRREERAREKRNWIEIDGERFDAPAGVVVTGTFVGGSGGPGAPLPGATPLLRPGESRRFTIGEQCDAVRRPQPRTWPATLGWLVLGMVIGWAGCAAVRLAGWW